jgi:heme/copper-type cytochrome/quinol oxidase subunit 1
MHGLGMAGLPRRIPDYPDHYSYLNNIMTIGTFLIIISIISFLINRPINYRPVVLLIINSFSASII